MSARRRTMVLSTASFAAEVVLPPNTRPLVPADAPGLARLMLDAYQGTIDDEGETLEDAIAEVDKTLAAGRSTTHSHTDATALPPLDIPRELSRVVGVR